MTVDECVDKAEWSLDQVNRDSVDIRVVQTMAQQAMAWALLALVKLLRERREDTHETD